MTAPATGAGGFVLFRLGGQTFATPLEDVREIVRLEGVEPLPGAQPPLLGVIVLRGSPLPVVDVREPTPDADAAEVGRGDVLVMSPGDDVVGVAVDRVVAVSGPDELTEAEDAPGSLPAYVVGVRRRAGMPVLLVDLHQLVAATTAAPTAAG